MPKNENSVVNKNQYNLHFFFAFVPNLKDN